MFSATRRPPARTICPERPPAANRLHDVAPSCSRRPHGMRLNRGHRFPGTLKRLRPPSAKLKSTASRQSRRVRMSPPGCVHRASPRPSTQKAKTRSSQGDRADHGRAASSSAATSCIFEDGTREQSLSSRFLDNSFPSWVPGAHPASTDETCRRPPFVSEESGGWAACPPKTGLCWPCKSAEDMLPERRLRRHIQYIKR